MIKIDKFVACNCKEIGPGFCTVEKSLVTYIGYELRGWWYWIFFIDEEDNTKEFLSNLMNNPWKYHDTGFSEGMFDNFADCIAAAFKE